MISLKLESLRGSFGLAAVSSGSIPRYDVGSTTTSIESCLKKTFVS